MDRNKNSIQMGYQCKNPFVCCLFIFIYIFVSRSFPLPSAFPSTDIERGKVFGLNTLRRRKIPTETACRPDLSTFKGYCTTFADEQRKGANDGIGTLIISQINDRLKCKSRKYVEIRTVANSLPRSQTSRINILFLADYKIIPNIDFIMNSSSQFG